MPLHTEYEASVLVKNRFDYSVRRKRCGGKFGSKLLYRLMMIAVHSVTAEAHSVGKRRAFGNLYIVKSGLMHAAGMLFCGSKLRGNILNKASAAKNIQRLHTAANSQNRNILLKRKLNKQLFTAIEQGRNVKAFAAVFFAVIFRGNIHASGEQKTVYVLKCFGAGGFLRKKRKNIRNAAAVCNCAHIIFIQHKGIRSDLVRRKNSYNGFHKHALFSSCKNTFVIL